MTKNKTKCHEHTVIISRFSNASQRLKNILTIFRNALRLKLVNNNFMIYECIMYEFLFLNVF